MQHTSSTSVPGSLLPPPYISTGGGEYRAWVQGCRLVLVYFRSFSFKNSSTLSVFHLSILKTSFTSLFSSWSFKVGSSPRTYFIWRLGKLRGLSLLMKACIWGYLPIFQLHTSRVAKAYFDSSLPSPPPESSIQQFLQSSFRASSLNCFNSSHELQSRFEENPNSLHFSGVSLQSER